MAQLLPDKERQRPLAWLLLAIALILVYYLFAHRFILRHLELNDQVDQLARSEGSFRALIEARPALEQRLAELRQTSAQSDYFLQQQNVNLASSELTTRLKEMISLHADDPENCEVLQQQNMRVDEEERFQKVAIKVRMRCEIEDLSKVLYHIESGAPYLFVDDLTIYRQVTRRRRGRELVQEKMLDVRFDLAGYIRQPGAQEADSSIAGR